MPIIISSYVNAHTHFADAHISSNTTLTDSAPVGRKIKCEGHKW